MDKRLEGMGVGNGGKVFALPQTVGKNQVVKSGRGTQSFTTPFQVITRVTILYTPLPRELIQFNPCQFLTFPRARG